MDNVKLYPIENGFFKFKLEDFLAYLSQRDCVIVFADLVQEGEIYYTYDLKSYEVESAEDFYYTLETYFGSDDYLDHYMSGELVVDFTGDVGYEYKSVINEATGETEIHIVPEEDW